MPLHPVSTKVFIQMWALSSLLGLSTASGAAQPTQIEPLAAIEQAARSHLAQIERTPGRRATVAIRPLDARIRVAKCGQPLDTFLPPGAKPTGHTIVGVRCTGAWRLFVSASVSEHGTVPVLVRDARRGETLTTAHLKLAEVDLARTRPGLIPTVARLAGQRLRRDLRAGNHLTSHDVDAPHWVKRGQQITLIAKSPGIQVRMDGLALTAGGPGDVIRAKNTGSNRVVEGVIIRPGVIE
ncbi:MAG: flagellar basal body P-ring formation protein FlgA, partial [Gammaproteobacteria bacterium]|nr:flagellar basal body P-ring formation protein FlgA [Gammaproteobacteria bacterium]